MRRLFKVGSDRHDIGRVTFSWHPDGNFLASAGKNGIVQVTDRHGDIVDEIPLSSQAPILMLAWDKDGDYLAILQDGNGVVPLWSLSSRRVVPLETNLRDPTFLAWSKTGPQLAIGTNKGNLLIYNKTKKQKIPVVGKHAKKICTGAWSIAGNKLVLGSEDKTLTISNENGDTLLHTEMKHIPIETHFANSSTLSGGKNDADSILSANLDGKSLILFDLLDEKEDPTELTFGGSNNSVGCKYGEIRAHEWFENGLVMVGFSLGHLLVISTNPKEMGKEKFCSKFHTSNFITFAYNTQSKRAASAGDDGIRIIDLREFRELTNDFIPPEDLENGIVSDISWSPDGQILTIGTYAGNVYNFLAKMSVLTAKYGTTAAFLSSLREVSVVDALKRSAPIDITFKVEPTLIAVGGKHVAAAMNNKVYFRRITASANAQQSEEREYVGTVRDVQLNQSLAVVLTDSKATLHPIESGPNSQEQTKIFPTREEGSYSCITCVALTDDFLYYGTEAGTVEVFFIGEFVLLAGAELRLDHSIKQLFPNGSGTRLVVVDNSGGVHLFNPVTGGGANQSITPFTDTPPTIVCALWDSKDRNVVHLFDGKYLHTYVFLQHSVKGPILLKIGPAEVSSEGDLSIVPDRIELPMGNIPIISIAGVLTCQTASGNLNPIIHPYFDHLPDTIAAASRDKDTESSLDQKELLIKFCQALALLKLEVAWHAALELDRRQYWLALSHKAMEVLNVELALRVYRQLGDAGMVMALEDCQHLEDRHLLAGHISLLFGDYQRAQELFLSSTYPIAALDMRRDLLQWEQALQLAQSLSPPQVPDICVQYGQQMEFKEEYQQSLKLFEAALNEQDARGNHLCSVELAGMANIGVARCNLRLGNIRQGIRLANDLEDKQLFADSGEILEQQKQYAEAASMYIKGEQYERAADMYIRHLIKGDKSKITEAALIMEKVQNDQLNSSFAKACVSCGRYQEAVKAYERANDTDKVVELKLRHLDEVQQAFDLVRGGGSAQGAQLVADYCIDASDFRGAIEFLLIANKTDDAFKLAQTHSLVEVYCAALGEQIGNEDALRVAQFYEKNDFGKAGRFYSLCGHYTRALKLFIQCGDREIDAAIEVVGKSQSDGLAHQLIDFLVGEKDGMPKDPNYIYRLYMALKKYDDAAKTALIIARQEQDMGNYSLAHSVVVEIIQHLEAANIKVSLQLRQAFVLLHSYVRVKHMVRSGDHTGAARMLLRVAQSASKFPLHVVAIYTSTVVECQRAGLKSSAYTYAVMLMSPDYRQHIEATIKKKIEAVVRRKSQQEEETPEDLSPCPISKQLIPLTQLECPTTRDALPMCVVSGRHMVLDDWCFCPVSKCPALFSEYTKYIEADIQAAKLAVEAASQEAKDLNNSGTVSIGSKDKKSDNPSSSTLDPVMGKPITLSDIRICTPEEAAAYIKRYNNVLEEKKVIPDDTDSPNTAQSPVSSPKMGQDGPFTSDAKQPTRMAY